MDDWLLLQNATMIYVVLALLLAGGAIGLPFPEDFALIMAGIFLQLERIELNTTLIVCYAGVMVGDAVLYFAGRWFGIALFKSKWFRARVTSSRIKHTRLRLEKRSVFMIFVARHLFYLRTVTFLTCGAVRMSPRKFFLTDAAAALISMPVMISIGYVAADNYEAVLAWFDKARHWTLLAIAVGAFAYLLHRVHRKRVQARLEAAKEIASRMESL